MSGFRLQVQEPNVGRLHLSADRPDIRQFFGRDLLTLTESSLERWLDEAVVYWRQCGFPYPRLSADEVEREFALVQRSSTRSTFVGDILHSATTGLRLANSFHPHMWHVRRKSIPMFARSAHA